MDQNSIIECGGFYFIYNFDSGNLGHVERVPTELIGPSVTNAKNNQSETPDYEFNLWTRPDCAGTEFENGNRTWFYFGVQACEPNVLVRLNLINLNKQGKMYAQGMAPVTRTLPGKPQWERIRDRPIYNTDDNTFTLSFKYRTAENTRATTFFAFTYPFSFAELQIALNSIDMKMLPLPPPQTPDDIYYHRECLIYSLEGRRVDLLTISSHHGITTEREERLRNLFPEKQERPFKFHNKKVIFISARVHPGETPSSFVFNGFLNLLLNRHDPIAIQLRKLYVFKMIPFLNPDGVARGHYRTDTRGVNLNRVYLNPSLTLHPTVYASRALIRFYHYGCEKEDTYDDAKSYTSRSIQNVSESAEFIDTKKKKGTQSNAGYRGGDYYKRATDKKEPANKSSTTLKQPSDTKNSKESYKLAGEAGALAAQVCDMSLREMPSQTSGGSDTKSETNLYEDTPSLLKDHMLRTCLGSNVHLSNSEELNFQAGNPLRPLRDTLKNSISLLMGSTSSVGDASVAEKDLSLSNVRMGWCRECRAAAASLERAAAPPNTMPLEAEQTYSSIDEYREFQKKQLENASLKEAERSTAEEDSKEEQEEGVVYFCTNCFKRYMLSADNEEILCKTVSVASVAVSAGDSGSLRAPAPRPARAPGTGDTLPPARPAKEDKAKHKPVKKKPPPQKFTPPAIIPPKETDSGLYLYLDLHGHASKKGIFMYGNHFEDLESCVECMLLPRIMSLNNLHFHFSSCNFTERNMYLKDRRDGMSREGSGRVAVLKCTGLVRSYTLECNYNTGRLVNVLPPAVRDASPPSAAAAAASASAAPPKYTPHIFEEVRYVGPRYSQSMNVSLEFLEEINAIEVGRSLGASILDLTGQHPNSRIPCSEHRSLAALRDWLRAHTKTMRPMLTMPRLRPKTASPQRPALFARAKGKTDERKENAYRGEPRRASPPPAPLAPLAPLAPRAADVVNLNLRLRAAPPAARCPLDAEPKPKALAAKRRNVLSIRKPNASKTQVGATRAGGGKARRAADDALPAKLGKRAFPRARPLRPPRAPRLPRVRALASSSSSDAADAHWETVAGGTALGPPLGPEPAPRRRVLPPASHHHLKKIRLKAGL